MVALDKTHRQGHLARRVRLDRSEMACDGAGYSSIVISNGGGVKQYVQLMGRGLVGVRASDGWFMWGNNEVANDIANIADAGRERTTTSLRPRAMTPDPCSCSSRTTATGRVNATQKYFLDARTLQNHHGGFVLIDGVIYGGHGHNNGFPFALDLTSGKMLWERARGAGTGSAAVTAADGHLYFRYQDGTMALIAVEPEAVPAEVDVSGFRTRTPPSWSHPVVTGGRLYLREQDALHAYNIKR